MPTWCSAARALWRRRRGCRMRCGHSAGHPSRTAAIASPPQKIWGVAKEKGGTESPPGTLKRAWGAPRLRRGSGASAERDVSRRFVDEIVGRRNANNRKRIELERPMLTALPKRRTADYEEKIVTVTSSGGFILRRVFSTPPPRPLCHRLRPPSYRYRARCCPRATPASL